MRLFAAQLAGWFSLIACSSLNGSSVTELSFFEDHSTPAAEFSDR